jgi:hypothetical protein
MNEGQRGLVVNVAVGVNPVSSSGRPLFLPSFDRLTRGGTGFTLTAA